jgi:cell surface protein SprA
MTRISYRHQNKLSPGWKFVLGDQDPDIRHRLAADSMLIPQRKQTNRFTQNLDKNISLRANLEPSQDLKIQLDVKKESSSNYTEIFRYDSAKFNSVLFHYNQVVVALIEFPLTHYEPHLILPTTIPSQMCTTNSNKTLVLFRKGLGQ